MRNVRSGIAISSAARFCTPPAALSASAMRRLELAQLGKYQYARGDDEGRTELLRAHDLGCPSALTWRSAREPEGDHDVLIALEARREREREHSRWLWLPVTGRR